MGRSFESVRMGVKDVSARWTKMARAVKKEDQVYALSRYNEITSLYKYEIMIYA